MPSQTTHARPKEKKPVKSVSELKDELTPQEISVLLTVLAQVNNILTHLSEQKEQKEMREKGKRPRKQVDEYPVFRSLCAKVWAWQITQSVDRKGR